jgi:flagellar motor switch protein FliN/FliY
MVASESALGALPVELKVAIPIPSFRVRDLVTIEKGRVLASEWANGEDLPLSCGDVQLVWTEFEVVDQKMAVRVTRLA